MKEDNDMQQQISSIKKDIKNLKKTINNVIDLIEQKLIYLRELTWDRDSKKESSKMYKVLENDKPSTIVRSNGSREYQTNENNINRLLTTYSETEYEERQDRGERGQLRREFDDRDFLRPASSIIPQSPNNSKIIVNRGFECRLLLKQ